METQIEFNRLNPQLNQLCRNLSTDLMYSNFTSHNLSNLKDHFTHRVSDLIDNAMHPFTTTRAELRAKLMNMETVKQVRFTKSGVSISLNPIVCSPSSNNTHWVEEKLHDCNKKPNLDITIPGLILSIRWDISNPNNTKFIYSLNVSKSEGIKYRAYSSNMMAHPHWIQRNNPCLGDFETSIGDAQLALDVPLQVTILVMFLSQYNPDDPAGKYIWKWAPEKVLKPFPFTTDETNRLVTFWEKDQSLSITFYRNRREIFPVQTIYEASDFMYHALVNSIHDDSAALQEILQLNTGDPYQDLDNYINYLVSNYHRQGFGVVGLFEIALLNTEMFSTTSPESYCLELVRATQSITKFVSSLNIERPKHFFFSLYNSANLDYQDMLPCDVKKEFTNRFEALTHDFVDIAYVTDDTRAILVTAGILATTGINPKGLRNSTVMCEHDVNMFYQFKHHIDEYKKSAILDKIYRAQRDGFPMSTLLEILTTYMDTDL